MQNLARNCAARPSNRAVLNVRDIQGETYFAQIDPSDIGAAFVFYNDRTEKERRDWVSRVFPGHLAFEAAKVDQLFSTVYQSRFDVVLVGSNDAPRVIRMLRVHIGSISDKPKLLLVKAMSPADRAAALMAGFDDVIDYTRATPEEVVARVRAIVRRYQISAADAALSAAENSNLSRIAEISALTARERRILEALAKRLGRPVSHAFLSRLISEDVAGASALYLRVVICCLRKKLRKGASIVARLGQGYELSLDPGVSM
ncbi:winged helix-turn-helix domain-containing protein [Novosphingobium sp.]|uniref:response regulator transcription factor n=1 Tax=Novosphingobium sp. TaxID=1874826 RepID=UPI0026076512|nr:winged helix-turn-helix domain-containing protein [Novosphingobium sp.]